MADDVSKDRPVDDPVQLVADETKDLMDSVRANKRALDARIKETTELLEESQRLLRAAGQSGEE